jgi:hypothetical protein
MDEILYKQSSSSCGLIVASCETTTKINDYHSFCIMHADRWPMPMDLSLDVMIDCDDGGSLTSPPGPSFLRPYSGLLVAIMNCMNHEP